MDYKATTEHSATSVILTDFSKLESRDAASTEELKPGDTVFVIYRCVVQDARPGIAIPLHPENAPFIVKSERAAEFLDKLIEKPASEQV